MQLQFGGRLAFGTISYDGDDPGVARAYPVSPRLSHVSFATPYQLNDLKLSFGIGYQSYFDYAYRYKYTVRDSDLTVSYVQRGGLNLLTPAAAISLQDRYHLGLSLSKSIGSEIAGELITDRGGNETEREVEVDTSSDIVLNLGGVAQINPDLSVGLVYRSGFEWTWENLIGSSSWLSWPGREGVYKVPPLFGIGVSYAGWSNVLLVAEYQNRPFSEYRRNGVQLTDTDDGNSFHLGAEMSGQTPIRFGVFREAIDASDHGKDDPLALIGLTGGVGLSLGGVALDAGVEYARWTRRTNGAGDRYAENLLRVGLTARYAFNKGLSRTSRTTRTAQGASPDSPDAPSPVGAAGPLTPRDSVDGWAQVPNLEPDSSRAEISTERPAATATEPITLYHNFLGPWRYTYGEDGGRPVFRQNFWDIAPKYTAEFQDLLGTHQPALREAERARDLLTAASIPAIIMSSLIIYDSIETISCAANWAPGQGTDCASYKHVGLALVSAGAAIGLSLVGQARLKSAVQRFNGRR